MNYPKWLIEELRSDHAGETGAVEIYRGILATCRDPKIREFASKHCKTEQGHLDILNTELSSTEKSKLLPIWRIAGFLTGAIPGLLGTKAVYATIDAVETYVDHHYQQQIDRLEKENLFPELKETLIHCQKDEVDHRDEAREATVGPLEAPLKVWSCMITQGSKTAVELAKRV